MDSNWPEISIEELKASSKNAIAMGPFGSRIKAENFVEDGVPVIKGGNLTGDFILEDKFDFLTEEKADELKASNAFRRDIVITHRGTIGQVGIIPDDSKFERYVVSQSQLKVTLDPEKVNPYFIYYFLRSPVGQYRLLMSASQVGVPAIAQASTSVKSIMVPYPEKEIQNKVVEIILGLDRKIHKNRQINQTLETMAQAVFKSWFVDFEPVKAKIAAIEAGEDAEGITRAAMSAISGKTDEELDRLQAEQPKQYTQLKTTAELFPSAMQDSKLGEIPEGWKVKAIQDLAKIIKGKSYKSAELAESKTVLVTLKSFNRGGGYRLDGLKEYTGSYKAEQEVFAGDLIIAYTDVTQNADVIGKPAMVVSDSRYEHLVISLDVAVVRPEIDYQKYFLYGLAMTSTFQNHTKSYTTGTTVLHLGKSAVPGFQFPKPSEELLKLYEQKVSPMFTLVNNKIEESKNMERLRDTLLPKLLSGELSVDAAEFAEEN